MAFIEMAIFTMIGIIIGWGARTMFWPCKGCILGLDLDEDEEEK